MVNLIHPPEDFRWPKPWAPLEAEATHLGLPGACASIFGTGAIADSLVAELQREVSPLHALAGLVCVAVGFNREDENEFLFTTNSENIPLAVVHLTWEVEKRAKWPWMQTFLSFEAFRAHFDGASG